MVALYVALIIAGRRTFNQVPAKFKAAVKADLEALGLDEMVILWINRNWQGVCFAVAPSPN